MATISRLQKLKMRQASPSLRSPRRMEICTEEPAATMSARAKLMMISGITRLIAARASAPIIRPTNIPSATV